MSAVSTYESTGRDSAVLGGPGSLAPVIDLAAERRRRLVRDADLQRALSRHPAGSALSASNPGSSGVTYRLVLPLYAKIVGWALAFALVAGLGGVLGTVFRAAPYTGETYTHSVAAGESLWGLAEGLGLTRDLQTVVEDIRALNGLESVTLHPGQEVILPLE